MDIGLWNLPKDCNEYEVTRDLARNFFHNPDANPTRVGQRLVNFKVELTPSGAGGTRNDGTGLLTVPKQNIGQSFIKYVKKNRVLVRNMAIDCVRLQQRPKKGLAETLDKTPFIDPTNEERRHQILYRLEDQGLFRVDAVQFGVFYRSKFPKTPKEKLCPRSYSIEWEKEYTTNDSAWLRFEYDHKLIKVTLGDPMTKLVGASIAISFANINKLGVGYDGRPYLCFDTHTPLVLEGIDFHRTLTGDREVDEQKYKRRIGAVDEGHRLVAPYAQHLRVILYHDRNTEVIDRFVSMCKLAGLAESQVLRCGNNVIDASKAGFFTAKRQFLLNKELQKTPWPVAFQIEALLRSGVFSTNDLDKVKSKFDQISRDKGPQYCGELLKFYCERIKQHALRHDPVHVFDEVTQRFKNSYRPPIPADATSFIECYHVTITPSRMMLDGPLSTQSNRILRKYSGFSDYFIRVQFRDETRLQYRWDRAVDGASFVRERVGRILKEGFTLGGREFTFLAYSSSALREHAVWFMRPFKHPEHGDITPAKIINDIGNFKGTELIKQPSKYAARIALAFTSTKKGVKIKRDEWIEVADIGEGQYIHSDGCGTISEDFGDKLWAEQCKENPGLLDRAVKPSVYQIRFGGYKGVVFVDEELDKQPGNIHMRLRRSMRKFDAFDEDMKEAEVEIAQYFSHSKTAYLNRPLITILEDRGVSAKNFIALQEAAIRDAFTIDDTTSQFLQVVKSHHYGDRFGLRHILEELPKYELDLKAGESKPQSASFDNPFFTSLRKVAVADVLREIKHAARIPIPKSYHLVGICDVGVEYKGKPGYENVFTLPEGRIFVCIQESPDQKPVWLKGRCTVSRSPVAYPGDIQSVFAIGEPPKDQLCLFANIKNAVVFSSEGSRSLPSMLGGGDLDGDMYSIIMDPTLLPSVNDGPAEYPSGDTWTLDDNATVDDICDFIVEYINSDVLGLLSDRLLVVADQSKKGIHDPDCLHLARLCSQAVDYSKHGNPVDLDAEGLPSTLIRCKPDWHASEVVSPRKTDYYESDRALGQMFRDPSLAAVDEESPNGLFEPSPSSISESAALSLAVESELELSEEAVQAALHSFSADKLFNTYADELRFIQTTHTLTNTPGVALLEAEIVIGTILAKCSQRRFRSDRIYSMGLQVQILLRWVKKDIGELPELGRLLTEEVRTEIRQSLARAWEVWKFCVNRSNQTGANSLGLVALGIVLNCLKRLRETKK